MQFPSFSFFLLLREAFQKPESLSNRNELLFIIKIFHYAACWQKHALNRENERKKLIWSVWKMLIMERMLRVKGDERRKIQLPGKGFKVEFEMFKWKKLRQKNRFFKRFWICLFELVKHKACYDLKGLQSKIKLLETSITAIE